MAPQSPHATLPGSTPDSASGQGTGAVGSNVEQPALAPLVLSAKSIVWGDPSPQAVEPFADSPEDRALRRTTLQRHSHRCMFCGLESLANEVHNRNDNHRDVRAENLAVADAICHRWAHLGQLRKGEGLIVYLPGLTARDVSHLLRTILVAMQCDDEAARKDAKRLLNWLASHHEYVEQSWGTSEPSAFAAAIARTAHEDRMRRCIAFENLALVINPQIVEEATRQWRDELTARWPVAAWPTAAHDVLHAPT
ncbi:hypothetical protein [Azohydromonas australica]|uniref:hypothetical protein n=1 Tax=Azohydromonas australica TaxID=364039 RepID=UPI000688B7FE|nr:hypothetical protein [Azohydromonas australica]